MEMLLVVCLIVILLVRWAYLRDRLNDLESQIQTLASAVRAGAPKAAPTVRQAQSPEPVRTAEPVRASAATPPSPATPARPRRPPVAEPVSAPIPETMRPSAVTPAPVPLPASSAPTPSPEPTAPAAPRRSSEEWETILGGNWLNKIGIFVLVVGVALALAYSYKLLGPAGRVAVSLALSLTMLVSGVLVEARERYRNFARGLIGGGWAALYFTVYAMHALERARVIESAWAGAILLLAVAVGMIAHSLRYHSPTVSGLAYFVAFGTLAITGVTTLSLGALIPLAASLLYVAWRFEWSRMALFGLIATYAICATRPDTGAPYWQVQTIFAIYWLLFEAFDILRADPWLLPLNAIGFLGLSLYKCAAMAPQHVWLLVAISAAAYLPGALLRARAGKWHVAITLSAALAAAAMFLKLDHRWIALGLLLEGELLYLAGVRLRAGYLRALAAVVFGVELAQLLAGEVGQVPVRHWTPIAAFTAAFFYGNRALRRPDIFYGFAAAALLAMVAGYESPDAYRATIWLAMAVLLFAWGWRRRMADFRLQGYLLTILGLTAAGLELSRLSLSVAAAASYALALCAVLSNADRYTEDERSIVSMGGSLAAALAMAALIWRIVPAEYLGLSWMATALLLLELGLRGLPRYFCRQAYALAALGALFCWGPWEHRWIPLAAALMAYAMAVRARGEEGGAVLTAASAVGTGFTMAALHVLLPAYAVAPAWAAVAIVLAQFDTPAIEWQTHLVSLAAFAVATAVNLGAPHRLPALASVIAAHYYLAWRTRRSFYLYTAAALVAVAMHFEIGHPYAPAGWAAFALALLFAGRRWSLADLRWQSMSLAGLAFVRCWYVNLAEGAAPFAVAAIVIACLYAAQLLSERESQWRLYYSLLATTLLSLIPYYQVAGSARTVVWGIEGVALLGSGFPLRDRLLRLSGLMLLLGCILKLFVWDLRHLETGPRILSFLVLGLFLVGVSWTYTRFRERVAQYL